MRYNRPVIYFLCILALCSSCRKEPQQLVSINKSYGGSRNDVALSMVKTPDGGYVIAGATESSDRDLSSLPGSSTDAWIFKINNAGLLQWSKKLGGSGTDMANSIINTPDGGLIMAGSSETADGDVDENKGDKDAWIIKLNKSGKVEWKKNFGGSRSDIASSIVQDANGNYVFTGTSRSKYPEDGKNHGESDLWAVKLDVNGKLLWQKTFGGDGEDAGNSIINSPDGGYIIAGDTRSQNAVSGFHGDADVLVVKLDADGGLIWQKAYGGSGVEKSGSLISSQSGGFIVSGITTSSNGDLHSHRNNQDAWLFEINNLGNIIWENAYKTPEIEGLPQLGTSPDGYSVVSSSKTSGKSPFMIMTVDPDGQLLKSKTFDQGNPGHTSTFLHVTGNMFMVAGSTARSEETDAQIFTTRF